MGNKQLHAPTIFVILGATGDLMAKKIVPALFSLYEKGNLPSDFRLLGVSRRDWNDADLRHHVETILNVKVPNASPASVASFLKLAIYKKLEFHSSDDYVGLKNSLRAIDNERGMCSNKLFYLSVPPEFYGNILDNLRSAGLAEECALNEGWTRVVVEKPFGNNEKSAKALDAKLAKIFKEDQIYRIDHYLAKETFQNVLAFRFYNNLFENGWGKGLIEKIYVRELENIGVEDRGPFYDPLGALRDVGQNHLLQMIALATMDQPRDLSATEIRKSRAAILKKLVPLSPSKVKAQTFRAQYEGYRSIKGVASDSETETYFRARFSIAHPRWKGVTFVMEAGKRLIDPREKKEITEIEVVFRHPDPCLCSSSFSGSGKHNFPGHYKNSIVFRQDPTEGITIHFWSKKPGFAMEVEERTFEFDLRKTERKGQYTEEYEKLLLDCIGGDQTLFVSSREIAAMWRFIDPIVTGWKKGAVPLRRYVPDSPAVTVEAQVIDEGASHRPK